MNVAIEMHDSECLAVERDELGQGFVLLDAYVHRSAGEPGVVPGEGGVQRIRIRIEAMTIEGDVGDLPAYIYEGSLTIGTSIQDNMVPFPAAYSEAVRLSVMLSDDARVIVVSGLEPQSSRKAHFDSLKPLISLGARWFVSVDLIKARRSKASVGRDKDEDEVLQQAAQDAKADHGMATIPPDMLSAVRAAIHEEK